MNLAGALAVDGLPLVAIRNTRLPWLPPNLLAAPRCICTPPQDPATVCVSSTRFSPRKGPRRPNAHMVLLNAYFAFAEEQPEGNQLHAGTHFAARAKNVIFLHMLGAPSHLDLFDYKPVLQKHDGELCPDKHLDGQRFAFLRGHPKLLGTKYKFDQHGQNGLEFSELLPNISSVADEICLLKTLHTEQFNHAPAQLFFQTGFSRFGRPSLGAWTSYGLGSENENLPAFVVLITGNVAGAGNSLWGSGFLPTVHQGVEFRSKGDPVLFLSNPQGVDAADRQFSIDAINRLNRQRLDDIGDPEIATRIDQYELDLSRARNEYMRENTNDTSAEAEAVRLELVRRMPAERRVACAIRLTSEMIRCSKAAIRRCHPELDEYELSLKFIELHYGAHLADAVRLQKGGVNH